MIKKERQRISQNDKKGYATSGNRYIIKRDMQHKEITTNYKGKSNIRKLQHYKNCNIIKKERQKKSQYEKGICNTIKELQHDKKGQAKETAK